MPLSNGRNTQERTRDIAQYLALHEVTATFLDPARPDAAAEAVAQAAVAQAAAAQAAAAQAAAAQADAGEFDLLLITGPDRGRKSNRTNQQTELLWSVIQRWPQPILIAA